MFARHLSIRYPDYPHHRMVTMPSGRGPERTAADVAERISSFVADETAAVTMVFPGLTTLEETARVMLGLRSHQHWSVTTSHLQPPPSRPFVALHASRQIPFGQITCPSEALVLGNFREFPATRRAPVTALEMFVGQPREHDPKTGAPTTKANLAHLYLKLPTPSTWDNMWASSEKGRTESLGEPDNRAKAKVTLVMPLTLARRLECVP